MRCAALLIALFACGTAQGQNSPAVNLDTPKLEELNAAQQKAVDDYVRQHERPTDELRVTADRNRIAVRSSEALRTLFPRYRFVAVTWTYQVDPGALSKYSLPGSTFHTLVLDDKGRNCMPNRTGDLEEFAELLRDQRIKVTDKTSAALVRSALTEIYGFGMSLDDLRSTDRPQDNSKWLLGYREWPFRAISSYEEVREASYYLLSVDASGLVVSGRLVNEVLERRKLKGDGPNH